MSEPLPIEISALAAAHLGRIRYDLYYRLVEAPRRLEILALWHASRGRLPPI